MIYVSADLWKLTKNNILLGVNNLDFQEKVYEIEVEITLTTGGLSGRNRFQKTN